MLWKIGKINNLLQKFRIFSWLRLYRKRIFVYRKNKNWYWWRRWLFKNMLVFYWDHTNDMTQIKIKNNFLDSGVKKLFIIGLTNIEESYRNIRKLWNLLNLNVFCEKHGDRLTITANLKLANILYGLMAHSSTHPCTWCNISKNKLHEKGLLRTVWNICEQHKKWTSNGVKIDKAKEFYAQILPYLLLLQTYNQKFWKLYHRLNYIFSSD